LGEDKWIKVYESSSSATRIWLNRYLDERNIPYVNKRVEYWDSSVSVKFPKYSIRLDVYVPSEYENEVKEYVKECVEKNKNNKIIPELPEEYKEISDAEYIEKLRRNPSMVKYLEKFEKEMVLNNKHIIKEVAKYNINILQYIDMKLANDKDIMYGAVSKNANALLYANEKRLNDEEIIQTATQQNVKMLELASDRLKSKKSFVKKLIQINKNAYKYISENLKNDNEILKLIDYDSELIRLYGNNNKKIQMIPFIREYWTMGERGWHDNHISNENIYDNITLEDFINKYLIYEINGYYKLLIIEDEEIIGTIYLYSRNGNNNYIDFNGCYNCKIKDFFKNNQSSKRLECREVNTESLTLQEKEKLKELQSDGSIAYLKSDNIELLSAEDIIYKKKENNLMIVAQEEKIYIKLFNKLKRFFSKGK